MEKETKALDSEQKPGHHGAARREDGRDTPMGDSQTPELTPEERRQRMLDRIDRSVLQVMPGKRVAIAVVVFAILFLLSSDYLSSWFGSGERSYATLHTEGVVETTQTERRKQIAASFPDWAVFSYPAPLDPNAAPFLGRIQVLVDPNCPYCRRLFRMTETLNQRGISIDYIVVPMRLESVLSMRSAVAVYCADEPLWAFESEMASAPNPVESCPMESLMEGFYLRAERMGAHRSRPYAITPDGRGVRGVLTPAEWESVLRHSPATESVPDHADT